mgnify:CR=1 FL=1
MELIILLFLLLRLYLKYHLNKLYYLYLINYCLLGVKTYVDEINFKNDGFNIIGQYGYSLFVQKFM